MPSNRNFILYYVACLSVLCAAQVAYVDLDTGSDAANCSIGAKCFSLLRALNVLSGISAASKTIYMAPGLYTGSWNRDFNFPPSYENITIQGATTGGATIIGCDLWTAKGYTFSAWNVEFHSITWRNCYASSGTAPLDTLSHLTFVAGYGAVVHMSTDNGKLTPTMHFARQSGGYFLLGRAKRTYLIILSGSGSVIYVWAPGLSNVHLNIRQSRLYGNEATGKISSLHM